MTNYIYTHTHTHAYIRTYNHFAYNIANNGQFELSPLALTPTKTNRNTASIMPGLQGSSSQPLPKC